MSSDHSDQVSQTSQVSWSLCGVVKTLIVGGADRSTKGQGTRSPIEMFCTKKILTTFKGHQTSGALRQFV